MKEVNKLKYYNGVKCLSHQHSCRLAEHATRFYLDSNNPPIRNWSHLSSMLLIERQDRSVMYASLEEPTIKISELMVSCPERFMVSKYGSVYSGRISRFPYQEVIFLIKDANLELKLCGNSLTGELFNQQELTFLLPFVKTLVDNHL